MSGSLVRSLQESGDVITEASLWIDFQRTACCRYLGDRQFEFWLLDGSEPSPKRIFSDLAWKDLIDFRRTIVHMPIQMRRDGLDVVITWSEDPVCCNEWARVPSESLRELVLRAVQVCKRR